MDAKISSTTWNDPDLDEFTPEMLLTLHWMKTNPDRNDCGAYRFSPSRFTFETKGLDPSWHDKTRLALGELMLNEGSWFLYLPFIRECLQLGDRRESRRINRVWQALAKPFQGLPKPMQSPLLAEYPEFGEVISEGNWNKEVAFNSSFFEEGLGKGMPRATQAPEQSRAEQSRTEGECEGEMEGAEVASEEQVLAFAGGFHDMARGLGPIPEGYALNWLAWRCSQKAGPFPRDWRKDLRLRFLADALEGRTTAVPNSVNGSGQNTIAARGRRAELEEKVKKAASPEERQKARDELKKLG